jgi:hypothetical protein
MSPWDGLQGLVYTILEVFSDAGAPRQKHEDEVHRKPGVLPIYPNLANTRT